MIILVSEKDKQFDDKEQAITELAFCHYPVTVKIENEGSNSAEQNSRANTFDNFDAAKEFVLNS